MSLNWNANGIRERVGDAEYDRITTNPSADDQWHPVTETLIWSSMFIGLNVIHDSNVDEWFDRITALAAVSDTPAFDWADGTEAHVTKQDIRNHIGLTTNASRMSKTAFYAHLYRIAVDSGTRMVSSVMKDMASAHDVFAEKARASNEA